MTRKSWITPFKKQCFVVIGASLNMSQLGLVFGYAACLLPQLKDKNSSIPINDTSASWIASLPGFALILGNIIIPVLMAKIGRKKANVVSVLIIIAGWSCIAAASNITWLLIARLLQGVSMGMSNTLTPILIGEYTSPRNRGAFTILMSLIMAGGTLTVHAVGSYLTWKTTAIICGGITLFDLLIVLLSPESPSWLADQGRYDDCEKVFLWLRGVEEIPELDKMIEANKNAREISSLVSEKKSVSSTFKGYVEIMKKKEFYKPIIIMIHLYLIGQWAGINVLAPFIGDLVNKTLGPNVDTRIVMISVDIQRVMSCVVAVFIIRNMKRRTMLFATCGLNALILLLNGGYVYAKSRGLLPFDHPAIGGFLIHALMITVAIGSLPLPFAIAGEIFPIRYRSLSSGFSSIFSSINVFLSIKTFTLFCNTIGLYGAYYVYAVIVIYSLLVVWFILPETKDRTLQDIEDDFKGKLLDEDLKSAQPLTVFKDVEDFGKE